MEIQPQTQAPRPFELALRALGIRKQTFTVALVWALAACGTEPTEPVVEPERFDRLWSVLDTSYVHFDLKGIDWSEVRSRLRPLATSASGNALAPILRDLVGELQDPHAALTVNGQRTVPFISPRTLRDAGGFARPNVAQFVILDSVAGGRIVYGIIPGNIGYVHAADFSALRLAEWSLAFNALGGTAGLIVDVRNNTGGSLETILGIAGYFTDRPTAGLPIFVRGRQVSSPTINPPTSGQYYANPTVVLINGVTVSAGESFSVMMGEMLQVTVIGDTTAGGGGSFSAAEPGTIDLGEGWVVQVPTTDLRRYDGTPVEWIGVPPDLRTTQSSADAEAGLDHQLTAALDYLASAIPVVPNLTGVATLLAPTRRERE